MPRETVVSNFKLKGREILSSYAAYTIEGVMTARVERGRDSWTIEERNGIAKGTSDGIAFEPEFYRTSINFENGICLIIYQIEAINIAFKFKQLGMRAYHNVEFF